MREQIINNDKVIEFEKILKQWNNTYNLIQKNSLEDFLNRHAMDSSELFDYVYEFQKENPMEIIADLGSGGGLPGVILCILGIKNLVLIDSCNKKTAFLNYVKRTLNLDFEVFKGRIETFDLPCKAFVSRALADSSSIIKMLYNLPKTDYKVAWLLKGPKVFEEVESLNCDFKINKGKFLNHTFILECKI